MERVTDSTSRARTAGAYLLGTWVLSAAVHVYLISPASVLPRIADGLGVPETTAIWLVSAVLVAWAATNFGVGVIIDRVGDVATISAGGVAVVGAAGVGWAFAARGLFWPLIGTRVFAGIAIGAVWIASTTLVGRLFPIERRGTALGVFTTSAPAGFAVGQVTGPWIAATAGWSAVLAVGGVLSAVAVVIFAIAHFVVGGSAVNSEEATTDSESANSTSPSVRQGFSTVLRNRTVVVGAVVAFAAYSLYLFLNSWLPTYLLEEFALSPGTSGLLAAVFPAMGVVSRAGGGIISDRLFDHRRLPVLKWSFVIATPVMVLIMVSRSVPVLLGLLILGGLVIQLTFGVVYSYVQEAVELTNEGTALSILGSTGIAGAFSAPVIAGTLIDLTGAYTAAFLYAIAVAIVGGVLVFFVADE
ncbi:nitrate/nitrite transporter [Halanaeroarchaeum sulfurireducens]|uniref:Nitrate/nitrite transporter n=1 Tax=Halanaeroarchaeum sulfurireducens TaxID=1604004 RepID=A0A0F7PCW4_9EURY|nr:nitrate/nitrite transporter [Halanaeroarchaeum sulfurireducens]ALG81875.1 nitrate/nitrite transporter [Halanaeroarchaeum sulfurireducens]